MPVLSFLNQKGGVGKTTLATNIATALVLIEGKKVFYIDADRMAKETRSRNAILSSE